MGSDLHPILLFSCSVAQISHCESSWGWPAGRQALRGLPHRPSRDLTEQRQANIPQDQGWGMQGKTMTDLKGPPQQKEDAVWRAEMDLMERRCGSGDILQRSSCQADNAQHRRLYLSGCNWAVPDPWGSNIPIKYHPGEEAKVFKTEWKEKRHNEILTILPF